jgi:histidinol-phosphatase (PHP family)
MTADYHMHTPLCRHAEGHPKEYAAAAVERGLAEIGFSDHSPMPEAFDDWRMLREDLPRYLMMVAEAREAFPELPVRLGLEVDFFTDGAAWIEELAAMSEWDYLIGSVHYIDGPGPEGRWDIDNPRHTKRYVATPGATDAVWDAYWETYRAAVASGFFDLMAHPDLPKKFGHRPAGDLRRYYEPVIAAAVESGVAIEINTAGWHKEAGEQYPAREFLELMWEAEIPLSISSDAHAPGEVGRDFGRAVSLAVEVGFEETVRFEQRRRTSAPLGRAPGRGAAGDGIPEIGS